MTKNLQEKTWVVIVSVFLSIFLTILLFAEIPCITLSYWTLNSNYLKKISYGNTIESTITKEMNDTFREHIEDNYDIVLTDENIISSDFTNATLATFFDCIINGKNKITKSDDVYRYLYRDTLKFYQANKSYLGLNEYDNNYIEGLAEADSDSFLNALNTELSYSEFTQASSAFRSFVNIAQAIAIALIVTCLAIAITLVIIHHHKHKGFLDIGIAMTVSGVPSLAIFIFLYFAFKSAALGSFDTTNMTEAGYNTTKSIIEIIANLFAPYIITAAIVSVIGIAAIIICAVISSRIKKSFRNQNNIGYTVNGVYYSNANNNADNYANENYQSNYQYQDNDDTHYTL